MNTPTKPRLSKKAGLLPGSLVYTGTKIQSTKLSLVRYDANQFTILENLSIPQAISSIGEDTCNWLLVSGFDDISGLEELGNHFEISPLILEDIFNVQHLPKVDDTGNSLFVTLKSLSGKGDFEGIDTEQISLYLGKNILITFQEKESTLFNPIIDRLRSGKGKGRSRQEDYLAYMLMDHLVDGYYLQVDKLEDEIEEMEQLLMKNPSNDLAFKFLDFKKSLSLMRRTIYPLKEEIRYLSREESDLIHELTRQHLSDIHDHLNHIIQTLDNYREMISAMMDLLLANNSNRMNSIMKTLTLVSTIFIPLTFAAGIYGMNFKYMPELEWRFGYPTFLLIIGGIGSGMYFYMKRKQWF